jgi:hypothetical protein
MTDDAPHLDVLDRCWHPIESESVDYLHRRAASRAVKLERGNGFEIQIARHAVSSVTVSAAV